MKKIFTKVSESIKRKAKYLRKKRVNKLPITRKTIAIAKSPLFGVFPQKIRPVQLKLQSVVVMQCATNWELRTSVMAHSDHSRASFAAINPSVSAVECEPSTALPSSGAAQNYERDRWTVNHSNGWCRQHVALDALCHPIDDRR